MSVPSHAGNIDTFGIGAKATALGGAFAAQADDPFALYYNPAGMSWVKQKKFSMGVQALVPDLQIENFHVVSQTQEDLNERQDPLIKNSKDFSNDSNALFIPNLGFSMPINDKITAGFAVYVPWGVELEFDSNPYNNPATFNAYHVYMVREVFTPGISYRINDKLSVGMGLSFGKSHTGLEKLVYIASDLGHVKRQAEYIADELFQLIDKSAKEVNENAPDVISSSTATLVLSANADQLTNQQKYLLELFSTLSASDIESSEQIGEYFASAYDGVPGRDHGTQVEVEMFDHFNVSVNLGLMYQVSPTTRFGLTYRSQAKESYKGDFKVLRPDKSIESIDAEMDYKQPDQLQWGIRYQPHEHLAFEMDMVWTQWSVMERQVTTLSRDFQVHTLPGNEVLDSQTVTHIFDLERNWVDTIQKRFGIEWYAKNWLTLRLGYFYDPTPIPDETMDFQWPDGDKKIYSLGMGIKGNFFHYKGQPLKLDNLNIDLVFQYGKSEYKRYLGGESHNMNESYDLTEYYHRHAHLSASGQVWGFGCNINYAF
jgi:long-chain fatty acid transport protein